MKDKIKQAFGEAKPSLIAILAGLLIGILLMLITGLCNPNLGIKGFFDGARLLILGIFSKGRDQAGNLIFGVNWTLIGNMLFKSAPLILIGLSCLVAFKAGLFNIGAPGQYLIGNMATLIVALSIPSESCPPVIIMILAFLGGMVAAALWGMIPGILKAYLNVNDCIAGILTNWIAANLVTVIFEGSRFINTVDPGKTGFIYKTSVNNIALPNFVKNEEIVSSQANCGITIAVIMAILVWVIIKKSVAGFEMRMCGANRDAAKYCGINEKLNIVQSMAFAGALTGIGAGLYVLSGNTEFAWSAYQTLPAIGFNGIPVALLACLNPIGVIFSSMLMSALEVNGQQIANLTSYNEYITSIIIGVIVYFSAFTVFIKHIIRKNRKRGKKK